MIAGMDRFPTIRFAVLGLLAATPAFAAGPEFSIANATDRAMSDLEVRRFGGNDWRPLGVAPAPGARVRVQFSDPDCAFDIRAQLSGPITATWSGVNLCEVRAVILHREPTGELWVDYE